MIEEKSSRRVASLWARLYFRACRGVLVLRSKSWLMRNLCLKYFERGGGGGGVYKCSSFTSEEVVYKRF